VKQKKWKNERKTFKKSEREKEKKRRAERDRAEMWKETMTRGTGVYRV